MSPPYKRKDMKENEKKNIETPPVTEKIDEELCQEVLEKYSQEEVMRKGSGWYTKVISILALMMAVFHVYTSGFGLLETMRQRPIHLMFVMVLVFLMYPGSKKQENRGPSVIDVALSVLALVATGYVVLGYRSFLERSGISNQTDIVMAILLSVLILERPGGVWLRN